MNFFNYLDRFIVAGVMPRVQEEFHLSNAEGGFLATIFMVVYMCVSPVGGFLGDRLPRRFLIAGAVLVWSLATVGSGLATSFAVLLIARALTGVGEAGYGTIAPAFISDLFPIQKRSRMLSYFYAALPLGAAAGFVIGGAVSHAYSWHAAFFVGGAPGILIAATALWLPEPVRGGMDGSHHPVKVAFKDGLKLLQRNTRFWIASAGLTLMTFSIGGLVNWMPKFLESERGYSQDDAGYALGLTTVIGGFVGTLLGGVIGDRWERKKAGGGVLLSAVGLLCAVPLMVLASFVTDKHVLIGVLLVTQLFLLMNTGPLNAAIVNAVPPAFRAFAVGINTLLIHLFGDAASPPIIGWVADRSSMAHAIALNAIPVALGGLILVVGLKAFRTESENANVEVHG